MRRLHLADLHAAACALRARPAAAQWPAIRAALQDADTADRYRKRLRKSHPALGHGTLSSAIGPAPDPGHCDRAYLQALQVVVAALLDQRRP